MIYKSDTPSPAGTIIKIRVILQHFDMLLQSGLFQFYHLIKTQLYFNILSSVARYFIQRICTEIIFTFPRAVYNIIIFYNFLLLRLSCLSIHALSNRE